jgi:hypothetical protein
MITFFFMMIVFLIVGKQCAFSIGMDFEPIIF